MESILAAILSPLFLGVLSGVLQIAGYILYIRNVEIEPNPSTWFMFAYGTVILTVLEFNRNASWYELLLPIICASMGVYVAFTCWKKFFTKNPNKWWPHDWWPRDFEDKLAFGGDIAITIAYSTSWALLFFNVISGESVHVAALVLLIGSNVTTVTAFIPILRSTTKHPEYENALPWVVWTCAYATLFLLTYMQQGLFSDLILYPLFCMVLHGLVAWLARDSRRISSLCSKENLLTPKVQVKESQIHGKGIFASKNIIKGEEVAYLDGEIVQKKITSPEESQKFADWIGVGIDTWVNTDHSIFRFINHSCEPNVAIVEERKVVAIKGILFNEEVTMDYSLTDADPYWEIICGCGSASCRKKVRSIQALPSSLILERMPNIPDNFQRAYINHYVSTQSQKGSTQHVNL